jgi:glycosyltransferase involved in cell wall biosynthesis
VSLSVILPNYNHCYCLPRALRALVSQAVQPTEIIVVDDGSTDDSIGVIQEFCQQYDSIRLIRHETNRGTAAAVKSGIAVATGEYLLFAAADDFVLPELVGRAERALNENPTAAFYCAEVAVIDIGGNIRGFRPLAVPRTQSGMVLPDQVRRDFATADNWFIGPSIVYRREALKNVGYFDDTLGSLCDALASRLLALRYGYYFDSEVLATWSIYPESLSARSALSETENRRLREVARRYIITNFPTDIAESYTTLFDRRLRFNMARLKLVWTCRNIDSDGVANMIDGNALDRAVLRVAARLPFAATAALAWMTLRMRPYGVNTLLRTGWRALTVNHVRRKNLRILIEAANHATAPLGHRKGESALA